MRVLRSHLTYANVVATLALMIALATGSAYAANTVFSTDIVDGEVKEADVGTAAVRADEIGQAAVETAELKNDAVTTQKVLNETLVGADVLDNTLKGADIDESTLSSIGGGGPAGGDLTGTYPNPQIAANAVGSPEIATDAVKGSEMADSSIDSGEIINNSLTTADIAGTDVNGGLISFAAGSVANGRCEDHPVATGGALTGEAALITIQGALPQGMLLYATRVPSNGTVTMKVCNLTGGTMPAITNLPIRTVTFG